jgi:N-acetylmuramoyl-L-alanine amidase
MGLVLGLGLLLGLNPAAAPLVAAGPSETVVIAGPAGLVELETTSAGHQRYVSLRALARVLGGSVRVGDRQGVMRAKKLVVTVVLGRSLAVVDGRAYPLEGLPRFRVGDVLLPVRRSSIGILAPGSRPPEEASRAGLAGDPAPSAPQLTRIRFWGHPGYTRLVLDTSGPVRYSLSDPEAQVIRLELKARTPGEPLRPVLIRDGVIEEVTPGRVEPEQIALAIRRGEAAGRVRAFTLQSPDRLVVDVLRAGRGPSRGAPARREDARSPRDGIRVVVLDPGHGGRDWGASGPRGAKEKDVVLDIALRLRRLLHERLGIQVILTRAEDVFVSLEERTTIANRAKGDLFLSLHVNADPRGRGDGFEAYFLARDPSDSEARGSALRENVALPADGLRPTDQDGVQPILWDITENLHVRESSVLAEALLSQLERSLGVRNRGIRSGPFAVLRHAAMPSVLVEVAFLTNPAEERRLQTEGHRQRLAEALWSGIARYKAQYERRLGLTASAAPS